MAKYLKDGATADEAALWDQLEDELVSLNCTGVALAWRQGNKLVKLRDLVKHGQWGKALRHFGISPSAAKLRMDLAKLIPSAEAAGQYRSMMRAWRAYQPNSGTCPRCEGKKQPEFAHCKACQDDVDNEDQQKAESKDDLIDALSKDKGLDHYKDLVEEAQQKAQDEEVKRVRAEIAQANAETARRKAEQRVKDLKSKVAKLEARIAELEAGGQASNSPISVDLDFPEVIPGGASKAVSEHCLAGTGEPWRLVTRNKEPVGAQWGKSPATEDDLAAMQPAEELAWVPGSVGLRCLDVDCKDGKKGVGYTDLDPLLEELGNPAILMRSRSRKGWHMYYRTRRRTGNHNWSYKGLSGEIRDSAGYVVVADPSAIYEKLDTIKDLEPKDDWSAFLPPAAAKEQERDRRVARPVFGNRKAWVGRAIETMEQAPKGSRNNTLSRLLLTGYTRYGLQPDEAEQIKSASSESCRKKNATERSARRKADQILAEEAA